MAEANLGEALKAFLDKSRIKSGVKALQIKDAWEQIMGKTVAKYTDKIQVVNKTLFVNTSVGPLKQELSYQKKTIIERVNELIGPGTIEEVVIR
ncbi:MAG: DUF721 domain-containing protein [Chitinophagaceae bacterium]|jgi:hypothetical protein|nr:DUF721 domain-containing protein [Chitinophagaceae bacterium]MCU0405341.1 DUF721 domain-containing protein [Chitinophagaceae bacterium]